MRSWQDYQWSPHALQRIAEYRLRLNKVFEDFEQARVLGKSDEQLIRDFVKNDWNKRKDRDLLEGNSYGFIVSEKAKVVVTMINHQFLMNQKERRKAATTFKVITVNGKNRVVPII